MVRGCSKSGASSTNSVSAATICSIGGHVFTSGWAITESRHFVAARDSGVLRLRDPSKLDKSAGAFVSTLPLGSNGSIALMA
jgi:hypothetical protein